MTRKIILFTFIVASPFLCWSQGKITRPKKIDPKNNHLSSEPILSNSTETINGITVKWNGVTKSQKNAITDLLKNMIYIEGGSFMMGSDDNNADIWVKPIHMETVRSFWLNKYEMTQKLWQAIMGDNPSYFQGENLPVEQVTWDDCQDFIKKINRMTGLNFRLPTEAEWEYAARGGKNTLGYQYSGSNNIDEVAWYISNSNNSLHPVGTKKPNELKIYDMSGNVSEWTSDKSSANYSELRIGDYIYRGGGYSFSENRCKVYDRLEYDSKFRAKGRGFRIAL